MKTLRPYQTQAIDASFQAWRDGAKNILLVMATGAGKSFVAANIIQKVVEKSNKKTLFMVHRGELVQQAHDTFVSVGLKPVVEMAADSPHGKMFDYNVVVASVQSLTQDKRLTRYNPEDFNLVVHDESQHIVAKSHVKILDYFSNCRVLGLTATPYRSDKVGLKNVFEKVSFQYPIADGIKDGFLCSVESRQVVVDGLHLESINITQGEFNEKEITALLMIEENLQQMVVPTIELMGDRPTIVFCQDVAHATAIRDCFNRVTSKPLAVLVHGAMPLDERRAAFLAYESGRMQYLINCMIATEGYDHPPTAGIALFRPLKSLGLLCQMVGRGTRISPGKDTGCLVLDFVGAANTVQTVNVLDVLDGTVIDAETKKKAQEYVEKGDDALSALEHAKLDVAKLKQMQAKMKAAYSATSNNLLALFGITSQKGLYGGEGATPKQIELLKNKGVVIDRGFEKGEAMKLISEIFDRQRKGKCTLKQARHLAKNGVEDAFEMSFVDASKKLNEIFGGRK